MKRSIFIQMITWLCLLSFGMHTVLHLGSTFHLAIGHSGHGDDHHSLVSHRHSDNSIYGDSELGTGLKLNDYSETGNRNHHTPVDHNPEPEDHDPTHHLTIQYRTTNQSSSLPFAAIMQHRLLSKFVTTKTQPSIVWTGRDVAVDFNPYVKCIRLIL